MADQILFDKLGFIDRLKRAGIEARFAASDRPEDVEPLAARWPADQEPCEAPQVAQERPVDEVGGGGEADRAEEVAQSPAFTQASSKRTFLMALPSGVK